MARYEWYVSNSGPRGFPMRVLDGDLVHGGGSLYIPRARVGTLWGQQVSQHVLDEARQPLPDSGAVLFYSYLEDRLYRLTFTLPRDSIERLFREGYRSFEGGGGRGAFEALVVGVAPGGAVAVWAAGIERQVEVFFGQAEAADVDWHRAMGVPPTTDRQQFLAASLAEAEEDDSLVAEHRRQPVPVGRWTRYRTRYRWSPVFEGLGTPTVLHRMDFVNGERESLALPLDPASAPAGRPAPRTFQFDDPRSGRPYEPLFDEEEIADAFARAGAGGRPVELVFAAPTAGGADPRVLVRGAETVALQRVRFLR